MSKPILKTAGSPVSGAARIFDLSLGELIWSRRTIFMALVVGAPVVLAEDGIISMRFEPGALVVETARPDAFYARVTEMAASGEAGPIDEVTSPDDNLQAVFQYLVKQ